MAHANRTADRSQRNRRSRHSVLAAAARPVFEALERRQLLSQSPYGGGAWSPGTRIEAENYDLGGEGVAYHDTTAGNASGSTYRGTDGVDVQAYYPNLSNGYAVGSVRPTEWLEYTVNVPSAGTYTFEASVAFAVQGGTFHAEFDGGGGTLLNKTGTMTVPNTGDYGNYTVISKQVQLSAGTQVMRVAMDAGGQYADVGDFDYFRLVAPATAPASPGGLAASAASSSLVNLAWQDYSNDETSFVLQRRSGGGGAWQQLPSPAANATSAQDSTAQPNTAYEYRVAAANAAGTSGFSNVAAVTTPGSSASQTPYGGTAAVVPGTVEVENFDDGGPGVAYADSDAGNNGGAYRTTNVDVKADAAAGNGHLVGWTKPGEWLEYTVSVAQTGSYDLGLRVASGSGGGKVHLEVDGANATGPITVANTGGWGTWQTLEKKGIGLAAGTHVLRLSFDSTVYSGEDVGNVDWLRLTLSDTVKLGGAVIGTTGSYGNGTNTRDKVFDGDLGTYFDANASSGAWAGLDLGEARAVTKVKYAPRAGWAGRMVGGKFQGSTTADFSSGVVDLFTVSAQPASGQLTEQAVSGTFRYVRYLSPNGGYGNVAEVEFHTPQQAAAQPPTAPLEQPGGAGDSPAGAGAGTGGSAGTDAGGGPSQGQGSVRYADGATTHRSSDLTSSGFGLAWGQTRGWTNRQGYAVDVPVGNGWVIEQMPGLNAVAGTGAAPSAVAVVTGAGSASYFDKQPDGSYLARFHNLDRLAYDAAAGAFTLADTLGNKLAFNDFAASRPQAARGGFISHRDPQGNATSVLSRNAAGRITEVQRTDGAATESFAYAYLTGGANAGLLDAVTWRRRATPGGAWSTVRTASYAYYTNGDANGRTGDLKTATVKDAGGATIDTTLYRYYTADSATGYVGGLKSVFGPVSFERLANSHDPYAVADATAAAYADETYKYDSRHRVSEKMVQGTGCSSCAGGQGTYAYAYETSAFPIDGSNGTDPFNTWHTKTTETLPDGSKNVVYANAYGQTMLLVEQPAGSAQEWLRFYAYDAKGREVLRAEPSAVSGYDATKADLLNKVGGNYAYLRDGAGVVTTTSYYASTSATATAAGGVAGYMDSMALRRGEMGITVPQSKMAYKLHTAGGATVAPMSAYTTYRNADGTGATTTIYDVTYYGDETTTTSDDTLRRRSTTVTYAAISSTQNGLGTTTGNHETMLYDSWGRTTWMRDGSGYLYYNVYDNSTGGLVQHVTDVDEQQIAAPAQVAANLPANNGLHLVSSFLVDTLGRATKETDPNGNVTYTLYKDADQEVRVYTGWDGATSRPTGPTQIFRNDRSRGYAEQLSTSVDPAVDGGVPTGSEPITSLESLNRVQYNLAWQAVAADNYFDLGGLSYSTAATQLGTEEVNFYRTSFGYDTRGRKNRVVDASGTINRTVFDGLNRPVSTWIGTNDAGATHANPQGSGGANDMLPLTESTYDAGGVGDSNLTKLVTHINADAAHDRVSLYDYDWRDRPVLARNGVAFAGGTASSVEAVYVTYDNLNRAVGTERFEGPSVAGSWATSNGVPDAPAGSLRTHKSGSNFDDRGRIYRAETFSVDPVTGDVGGSLKADTWYDARGNIVKGQSVGGLVTKVAYDGANRPTLVSLTDGGGDLSLTDALNTVGDVVLEEYATTYDAASNPILTTTKLRFHSNATSATGPLGTATTGTQARVSHEAFYYDRMNRLVASANVGTNGGTTFARPAGIPARSDTVLVDSYAYDAAGNPFSTVDTRGIETRSDFDDLGRRTSLVENYVDGTPSDGDDRTTRWTYNGVDNVLTMTADLPAGQNDQTTSYNYNARVVRGDALNVNNSLVSTAYPVVYSNGIAQPNVEAYRVNRVGEQATLTDRNGTVHGYAYDLLGRTTADSVTTLGAGVDGGVRGLTTTYDRAGRPHLMSSLDDAGAVMNQVERTYNGLGQLTKEGQEHAGVIDVDSLSVDYAYQQSLGGGKTYSRLSKMTYPDGYGVFYAYNGGIDGSISRLSHLNDGDAEIVMVGDQEMVYDQTSATWVNRLDGSGSNQQYVGRVLESYDYLGLGTVIGRRHPEPKLDLVYYSQNGATGDAGDVYTGLDRFGRTVDQRWVSSAASTWGDVDRFGYGYDRAGNRTYEDNTLFAAKGELYTYDALDRLVDFKRGTLNAAKTGLTGVTARGQGWSLDALGNWKSVTTDGSTQTRTHDDQNRITAVGGAAAPTYSANGEMTGDETGQALTYDAWGRLNSAGSSTYGYDALYRRVTEGGRDLYYSKDWQVLQENTLAGVDARYVWSPVYVDAMVLRDRDTNGDGVVSQGSSADERLYATTDANYDVTGLVTRAGVVVERYAYDPYGTRTVLDADGSADADGLSDVAFRYGHQGGRHDLAAGLVSFRFRFLDTSLGRWEKQDPAKFADGMSLYMALDSSPISHLDPSGLLGVDGDLLVQLLQMGVGIFFLEGLQGVYVDGKEKAEAEFPGDEEKNNHGKADAFRHCYGSCFAKAIETGIRGYNPENESEAEKQPKDSTEMGDTTIDRRKICWTEVAGIAKETMDDRHNNQIPQARDMDLKNNTCGRKIADGLAPNRVPKGSDPDPGPENAESFSEWMERVKRECAAQCKAAANDGTLTTLPPGTPGNG